MRFVSLFVADLEAACQRYQAVLGVPPQADSARAPRPHPFAAAGPVVFDLGGTALALYQCDGRATHPGDVGIGLEPSGDLHSMAERAAQQGGKVFFGPRPLADDGRVMAVFVLPDRHFFELLGPPPSDDSPCADRR